MRTVRFIGPGRAGRALALALATAGWEVVGFRSRHQPVDDAADGVDVLVLSVPDDAVAAVAAAVEPREACAVVHLSGSLGLDVLTPHPRRASVHPLVPLPDPARGAVRLRSGATFAVAGDPAASDLVAALGGIAFAVPDGDRALYHAAACVAANHLVGLLGQVERLAAAAGLPLGAFLPLAHAALEDVAESGPRRALTGPAARGDRATLERHLAAMPPEERAGYRAGVALALQVQAQVQAGAEAEAEADHGADAGAVAGAGAVVAA